VILANIFCPVYDKVDSKPIVFIALKIMRFCGDADPQARRYQTILESFLDALQIDKRTEEQITDLDDPSRNIFNMLFGNDVLAVNGDTPLMVSRIPPARSTPLDWVDSRFAASRTGLDALGFASGVQEENVSVSSWMEELAGKSDDSIDGNGIWWNAGQDVFTASGDIRVPLYGLMEPM
jgi:hypothetical protein